MPTLSELKLKYPAWDKMKYEPVPECPKCHGTGELPERKLKYTTIAPAPCMCTYVGDAAIVQEFDGVVTKYIDEFIQKLTKPV
jgi:hypothetical protein